MSDPLLIARGSKGLYLLNGHKPYDQFMSISDKNTIRSMDVSLDGQHLAIADHNSVKVLSLPDCEVIFEKNEVNVNSVKLSPKCTVLSTWHHFTNANTNNLNIYNVFTKLHLNGMTQKKPSRWCPQWTEDESVSVRHINMELQFYENNRFDRYVHKMCSQKVANYSMTTNRQTGCHYVACYTTGVKGQPSFVRIYQYPRFEGIAIANKSFYKADNVDFKWSHKGDALLLICSTDVDQSGKSYYGQQTLHYLDISGQTFIVKLNKDGPIHNMAWVPNNSTLFCVIYGFMPSKTSLFNNKAEIVFEFGGPEMRNIISFNQFGNLVALAGFGNLRGGVQVWDLNSKALVSEFKAPDSTLIDWCPDGRRILTATTSPRLRVGNGYRIWSYDGIREHEVIYDTNTELNEIVWQPSHGFSEPVVEVPKKTAVKKPTEPVKYVPPHMRKDVKPKPTSSVNSSPLLTENEKKSKNLKKKLQQIDELKQLIASGKQLEKNQLEKVSKEQQLIDELRELELNS